MTATAHKESNDLLTPTDLPRKGAEQVAEELRHLLADIYALYFKTKNFHWHMSGPHFRDYHLLLDEQADQLFASTDEIAERVRKIGGITIRSIGEISRLARLKDSEASFVDPIDMLAEIRDDNQRLVLEMREVHNLCGEHGDIASASLLENWTDEAQRRIWFLYESSRNTLG